MSGFNVIRDLLIKFIKDFTMATHIQTFYSNHITCTLVPLFLFVWLLFVVM